MHIDVFGGGQTIGQVQAVARQSQAAGFEALWIPEGGAPAFSLAAVAAAGTDHLALGTGVAIAFARSPMVTAQAAWMLAEATGGNFHLGLGTQVKAHVERRYGAPFDPPGPRMAEYVGALRAIFAAFAGREKLSFSGNHYSFSLLPPAWSPGPLPYPDPPIYLAGVRPWMCRMIGETADGVKIHPLHTLDYIESVVRPNLTIGCQRAGRSIDDLTLVCPVMTAVSDDEESLRHQRDLLRQRLAFYGSTSGYGVVFDASGWPGAGERLNQLMRQGATGAMAATITDEMLDAFAVSATWADLPKALLDRYQGKVDRLVLYSVVEQWRREPDSADRWQDVVRDLRGLTS